MRLVFTSMFTDKNDLKLKVKIYSNEHLDILKNKYLFMSFEIIH